MHEQRFWLEPMPKSFMAQNTVFLLMTALIRNFYKTKGIVVKGERHLLNPGIQ